MEHVAEARHLLAKIGQYLEAWRERLAEARARTREAEHRVVECRKEEVSIQMRLRMLKQLSAMMDRGIARMGRAAPAPKAMETREVIFPEAKNE